MKRNLGIVFVLSVTALAAVVSVARGAESAAAPDGKAVFVAQKCNLCHALAAASITPSMKSSKAPDLSGVGADHDAAWIEKVITRKEKLNGKDHQKMFTGTPAELKALSGWLAGMKQKH